MIKSFIIQLRRKKIKWIYKKPINKYDPILKIRVSDEIMTILDNKLIEILYLIFNYPHKHYTFKHFEV